MSNAAFQTICSEMSTKVKEARQLEFPPTEDFLERCEPATRMRKSYREYKWERECYPPVGASTTPPTERQWKATEAGQSSMRENPNAVGGESNLHRLVNILVEKVLFLL